MPINSRSKLLLSLSVVKIDYLPSGETAIQQISHCDTVQKQPPAGTYQPVAAGQIERENGCRYGQKLQNGRVYPKELLKG